MSTLTITPDDTSLTRNPPLTARTTDIMRSLAIGSTATVRRHAPFLSARTWVCGWRWLHKSPPSILSPMKSALRSDVSPTARRDWGQRTVQPLLVDASAMPATGANNKQCQIRRPGVNPSTNAHIYRHFADLYHWRPQLASRHVYVQHERVDHSHPVR